MRPTWLNREIFVDLNYKTEAYKKKKKKRLRDKKVVPVVPERHKTDMQLARDMKESFCLPTGSRRQGRANFMFYRGK